MSNHRALVIVSMLLIATTTHASDCGGGDAGSCGDSGVSASATTAGYAGSSDGIVVRRDDLVQSHPELILDRDAVATDEGEIPLRELGAWFGELFDSNAEPSPERFVVLGSHASLMSYVHDPRLASLRNSLERSPRWRAADARGANYVRLYVALALAKAWALGPDQFGQPVAELSRLVERRITNDFEAPRRYRPDDLYRDLKALRSSPEFADDPVIRAQFDRAIDELNRDLVSATDHHSRWRLAVFENRTMVRTAAFVAVAYAAGLGVALRFAPQVLGPTHVHGVWAMGMVVVPILAAASVPAIGYLRADRNLDRERDQIREIAAHCERILRNP